jgi:hypothetical protein
MYEKSKWYRVGKLENYEHMYEYALNCLDEAREAGDYPPLTPEHVIAIGQALDRAVDKWMTDMQVYNATKLFNKDEPEPNKDIIFAAAVDAMTIVDRKRGYIKKVN